MRGVERGQSPSRVTFGIILGWVTAVTPLDLVLVAQTVPVYYLFVSHVESRGKTSLHSIWTYFIIFYNVIVFYVGTYLFRV